MSMTEILAELPKLTPTQRAEVRSALASLDDAPWADDGELSAEDKALLLARVEECDRHPERMVPWEQAEARLKSRFGG